MWSLYLLVLKKDSATVVVQYWHLPVTLQNCCTKDDEGFFVEFSFEAISNNTRCKSMAAFRGKREFQRVGFRMQIISPNILIKTVVFQHLKNYIFSNNGKRLSSQVVNKQPCLKPSPA